MKAFPSLMYMPRNVKSSSSGFNDSEAPSKLVDGDGTSTKWCANTSHKNSEGTWDIIVKTAMPVRLQAIKLWNGNDTKSNDGRRWKEVKISGSTSATGEWTEIKTFADANLAINNSDLAGTLDVNATTAYEYYKVEVLSVVDEEKNIMQMSDMKFVLPETQAIILADDKLPVNRQFNIPTTSIFTNYINAIRQLRNACAHGNIIYDIRLSKSINPGPAGNFAGSKRQRLAGLLDLTRYMLKQISQVSADEMWKEVGSCFMNFYVKQPKLKNIIEVTTKVNIADFS